MCPLGTESCFYLFAETVKNGNLLSCQYEDFVYISRLVYQKFNIVWIPEYKTNTFTFLGIYGYYLNIIVKETKIMLILVLKYTVFAK